MKCDIKMFEKLAQILQYKGTPIGTPVGYPIWDTPCFKVTHIYICGFSLTLWGEGASKPWLTTPSSNGVTIKMPYGVDVLLHQPASHPISF